MTLTFKRFECDNLKTKNTLKIRDNLDKLAVRYARHRAEFDARVWKPWNSKPQVIFTRKNNNNRK